DRKSRNGVPDELAMMDMREAHKAIADIIGDEIDEEVLDQIFSRFCIGK
ncbi:MAG TPA: tRNA uridine-5-carboxymethylaminomethyl(34) synthesis GTPase MnmE, partial [Candidatus Sumerlaeota bacterium]|nr:tRNA uridine-5-carboxymethylaminomethyl(34) synthesis GTPase MnmE [Candidatus Sumerlaeota bacterium]